MNYYHSQRSDSMRQMVQFKLHSEECGEALKHSRDEILERGGARPKVRGRSETRCHTISSEGGTPEHSLVRGYSALAQCLDSLKRERMLTAQTTGPTPAQSPAQKNSKLKSVMFMLPKAKQQDARAVEGWQPNRQLLYHSMLSKPDKFIMFIMHSMTLFHNYYEAEFDDDDDLWVGMIQHQQAGDCINNLYQDHLV